MKIDPYDFVSYPVWLSIAEPTRYKIAALFGVEPRGVKQTILEHGGGKVITDGFLHSDLAVITREKMGEVTGIKSDDFNIHFKALVEFVEGKLNNTNNVQQEEQAETNPGTAAPARRGRPRRQA